MTERPNITTLLEGVRAGDGSAAESLFGLVYDDLRERAAAIFSSERNNHTLQPTALVNEVWLKLGAHLNKVNDRVHFFAVASQAMRRILIDHARSQRTLKRGAHKKRITLDERLGSVRGQELDLIDLSDSLDQLASLNDRHAKVVELRFLGGLTISETAEVLRVSPAPIEADWFTARSWLRVELGCA